MESTFQKLLIYLNQVRVKFTYKDPKTNYRVSYKLFRPPGQKIGNITINSLFILGSENGWQACDKTTLLSSSQNKEVNFRATLVGNS